MTKVCKDCGKEKNIDKYRKNSGNNYSARCIKCLDEKIRLKAEGKKRCKICKKIKKIDSFMFMPSTGWYYYCCKECDKKNIEKYGKNRKKKYKENKETIIKEKEKTRNEMKNNSIKKRCSICKENKTVDNYSISNVNKDGYKCTCKKCRSKQARDQNGRKNRKVKCIICGKYFNTYFRSKKLCSKECQRKNKIKQSGIKYKKNKKHYDEYHNEWERKNKQRVIEYKLKSDYNLGKNMYGKRYKIKILKELGHFECTKCKKIIEIKFRIKNANCCYECWRKYDRKLYEINKEHYSELHKKYREELTDSYVRTNTVKRNDYLGCKDIPNEIVEYNRWILKLKRALKQKQRDQINKLIGGFYDKFRRNKGNSCKQKSFMEDK